MARIIKIKSGSITSSKGFFASGIRCGLKKNGNTDMALIFSKKQAITSASFTSNLFAAAPVKVSKEKLSRTVYSNAIIINSGNANACTGKKGDENAERMSAFTAELLGIPADNVLIASTGRIGVQMPMDKIQKGIRLAVPALSKTGGHEAAQAIMTTDTCPKETAVSFMIEGKPVTVAGMVKGAGMIAPCMNMHPHATMLCFITTDAKVTPDFLNKILSSAIEKSFNRISVDGDMSTNDSVFVMANGESGTCELNGKCENSKFFSAALTKVLLTLAKKIVLDGEGVTKFVTIEINNAANDIDARKCAQGIANSLLCKTAWFGGDPNWGRVVAAAGYSGAKFNPDLVNIFYDKTPVVINGGDVGKTEEELAEIIKKRQFTISIDLKAGKSSFTMWTNDLSYEYVKINADYHT